MNTILSTLPMMQYNSCHEILRMLWKFRHHSFTITAGTYPSLEEKPYKWNTPSYTQTLPLGLRSLVYCLFQNASKRQTMDILLDSM